MRSAVTTALQLVVLAAAALAAGCSNNDGSGTQPAAPVSTAPTGAIEIIHASQDAPAVNVRIGGNLIFSNVPFKGARYVEYQPQTLTLEVEGIVPGGNVTVIPASGDPAPSVTVDSNQRISVVAAGNVASIAPIVLVDTPPAVAATDVRLRVLHAASNAPQVDVHVTAPGDPLGAPLGTFAFGETIPMTDALVVPAGTYQVRVTLPGTDTVVYDSGAIDLPGGADLLIAAVANTGPGAAPISLLASTGAATLEFLDIDTPSDVRIAHASPDAPDVDVYVDGNLAIPGLGYAETTPGYVSLDPGTINVQVTPAGAPASSAVIDADLALTQGASYSVFAVDLVANIQPLVLVDDVRRVATEARVRLIHASPAAGNVDIYVVAGGTGGDLSGATPAFENVPFLAETGFVALAPGDYDVVLTPTGSKVAALGPIALPVAAGGLYTAAAIDQVNGGLPLGLILLDDLAP
ncbi:MAG: DUF4397 domain-containing protein [Pseudomonadales bacterium]